MRVELARKLFKQSRFVGHSNINPSLPWVCLQDPNAPTGLVGQFGNPLCPTVPGFVFNEFRDVPGTTTTTLLLVQAAIAVTPASLDAVAWFPCRLLYDDASSCPH